MRFRRSITLAPGIKMNLSGSGLSWTLGPKGASVGIGSRGAFLNSGIPGTGLYSRQKLSGAGDSRGRTSGESGMTSVKITVLLSEDGEISFQDAQGNPLSDRMVSLAKKQNADAIKSLIQSKCDEINDQVEALGRIHWETPDANVTPRYDVSAFPEPKPSQPQTEQPSFFAKFFASLREKVEVRNRQRETEYREQMKAWDERRSAYEQHETRMQKLVHEDIYQDHDAMSRYLEMRLAEIVWPRETLISFDISPDGTLIELDVDLPEYENMPTKHASVPQRGYRLSIKELGDRKVRQLYADHIHAIGFRIIGEAFAALPMVQHVILSAYSQRQNTATGVVGDEYLYSVKANRKDWQVINFVGLKTLSATAALERFECRREMKKTGIFSAIAPFDGKLVLNELSRQPS